MSLNSVLPNMEYSMNHNFLCMIIYLQKLNARQYPLNSSINSVRPETLANYIAKIVPLGYRTHILIFNTIELYLEHNDLIPKDLLDHDKCHEPPPNGDKMDKLDKYNAEIKKYKAEKNKQKFLIKLLKIIDFGSISISEFFTGPSESKLLTTNQKYFILTRICKSTKPIKLYQAAPDLQFFLGGAKTEKCRPRLLIFIFTFIIFIISLSTNICPLIH